MGATLYPSTTLSRSGPPRRPPLQPQNRAERRKPMRKVRRPIQRIDVPPELALHLVARALLAVDPVFRKRLRQPPADQRLTGPVGLRHQVHIALVLGLH